MKRTLSLFASAIMAAMLFGATTAHAASVITAQLAEAPAERVQIVRDTAWVCNGETCTTENARSNARHECIRFARELGTVTAFTSGDRSFDAAELAACNGNPSEQRAQR